MQIMNTDSVQYIPVSVHEKTGSPPKVVTEKWLKMAGSKAIWEYYYHQFLHCTPQLLPRTNNRLCHQPAHRHNLRSGQEKAQAKKQSAS